ncbi:response regulator [Ectothiorhodospiraceae bacterium WFHF3C12]|nr:response regulator [Ectothiorhodospiraceae bacterium WFHF3C12]
MTETTPHTLIVDDDEAFAATLARMLGNRGHETRFARDWPAARELLDAFPANGVVLDLRLEASTGLDILPAVRQTLPRARVVVLSAYASIAATVAALKAGADDVMSKPADLGSLDAALRGESPSATQAELAPLSAARAEWEHIERVLAEHDGNISATARALGMHRRTLQRKLNKRAPR